MPGVDQDTTGALASASSNNWTRGGGGFWKSQLGGWLLLTGMHLRCRVGVGTKGMVGWKCLLTVMPVRRQVGLTHD